MCAPTMAQDAISVPTTRRYKRTSTRVNDPRIIFNDIGEAKGASITADDVGQVMRGTIPVQAAGGGGGSTQGSTRTRAAMLGYDFDAASSVHSQRLNAVKWKDTWSNRNLETASVVTSYETSYQTAHSLRKKLDRAMTTLVRIRAERDHIKQEYKMIMAERDNVHGEIERLQEHVSQLNATVTREQEKTEPRHTSPCDGGSAVCEQCAASKSNSALEIERLRANLGKMQLERDAALEQVTNLYEKISDRQMSSPSPNANSNNNNNSSSGSRKDLLTHTSNSDGLLSTESHAYDEERIRLTARRTHGKSDNCKVQFKNAFGGAINYLCCCFLCADS